jgi:hypothetical protein
MLPKDRLERVIAGLRELGEGEDAIEAVRSYVEGRSPVRLSAKQRKDFRVLIELTERVARRFRDGHGIH